MEWDRDDSLNASAVHVHIAQQWKTAIKWQEISRASKIQLNILVAALGQISFWFYISANSENHLKSLKCLWLPRPVRDSRALETKLRPGNFQLLSFLFSHLVL